MLDQVQEQDQVELLVAGEILDPAEMEGVARGFGAGRGGGVEIDHRGAGQARLDGARLAEQPAGAAADVEGGQSLALDAAQQLFEHAAVEPLLDPLDRRQRAAGEAVIAVGIDFAEPAARHVGDRQRAAFAAADIIERVRRARIFDVARGRPMGDVAAAAGQAFGLSHGGPRGADRRKGGHSPRGAHRAPARWRFASDRLRASRSGCRRPAARYGGAGGG